MKAMIFAAGLGTRLKPLTNNKPKALVEIEDKTFLELAIIKLKSYGIHEIVVNVHHYADQIKTYLKEKNNFGVHIDISDECGQLLDTGGGLKKAEKFLTGNSPFILFNVDVLSNINLVELVEFHLKEKALATIAVRNRKTQRYFMFDELNQLVGWKNYQTDKTKISVPDKFPDAIPLAFSGIHVVSPELFKYINQEGKFSIIDTYLELAKNQKILGFRDNSSLWMDIGKPEELKEAQDKWKDIRKMINGQ